MIRQVKMLKTFRWTFSGPQYVEGAVHSCSSALSDECMSEMVKHGYAEWALSTEVKVDKMHKESKENKMHKVVKESKGESVPRDKGRQWFHAKGDK